MVKLFKKIQKVSNTKTHTCPNSNFILFIPPFSSFLTLFHPFSPYSQQTSISIKSQHPSYPGFKKKHVFDVSNSMTSYVGLVNEHCSGLILQRKFQGGLYIYIETHCHLNFAPYFTPINSTIGINGCIWIGFNLWQSKKFTAVTWLPWTPRGFLRLQMRTGLSPMEERKITSQYKKETHLLGTTTTTTCSMEPWLFCREGRTQTMVFLNGVV